ncbi:MAG: NAD(P)H-dependent glycerol-3-phosphate dehydrogenase [Clostridia bacterium]|nr:NAD(P)H-dependent glycerol-3-phosphate dehydrogenase [Clostridia bacterium]
MKITVIGCGRWGSFITWYLNRIGHDVTLYGRKDSAKMQELRSTRSNGLLSLPESITLSNDISCALSSDIIVISIASQSLKLLVRELSDICMKNKTVVLAMKGIDTSSNKRLSQIAAETLDASNKIAVWLGPGHVQEFVAEHPNCMVIDSIDTDTKHMLVKAFSSDLVRFYYGNDLIGNEIGAAAKNVIGIAAGILDGMKLSSLKGALMSRGTHEIAKLIEALGGNAFSAYGLCHLGDYEATVFSEYSHNRRFGESRITGESFNGLAEGYYTVKALVEMSKECKLELPICNSVYDVIYKNADPAQAISSLFTRKLTNEF